jgi:hypothetical protein
MSAPVVPRVRSHRMFPGSVSGGPFAARAGARVPAAMLLFGFTLFVAAALLAAPRRTGDAHQYLAMAWQLSRLQPPALDAAASDEFTAWLMTQPEVSGFPEGADAVRQPALVRDGVQEFSHFWVYPLVATPATFLAQAMGFHPITAFVVTNALLLGIALSAVKEVFGALPALLLLASPLIWFVARAQVEVFTVAFLSLAMCAAARGRWGWGSVAVAVAATQNAPIAAVIPLFWAAGVWQWTRGRQASEWRLTIDRGAVPRALAFATAATAIAALHPLYYAWRLGVLTPQQLNGGIAAAWPSRQRFLAVLLDPDIGFVWWLPGAAGLAVAGCALLWRDRVTASPSERQLMFAAVCGLVMGAWFLFVFSQTTNVNSGGTVHVSRYALWLLPLTLPLLAAATERLAVGMRAGVTAAVLVSVLVSFTAFHPDQPERYVEHSPQATWLIDRAPSLYRPLPEIFVERTLHVDGGPRLSAADPSCRLILIVAAAPDQPCPLQSAEMAAASEQYATGATAVWIRRSGDGPGSVTPALPER